MAIRFIDLAEARRIVRMAVDVRGWDFRYEKPADAPRCQYLHVDETGMKACGCLIGTALFMGGYVTLEQLGEMDEREMSGIQDIISDYLINLADPIELTQAAADALAFAQSEQDAGASWGAAYDWAFDKD